MTNSTIRKTALVIALTLAGLVFGLDTAEAGRLAAGRF